MIAIISLSLFIFNIVFPRSKYTYYSLLFFMWIIMSFTYNIADEGVYLSRYNDPEIWIGQTEFLFSLSTSIFRWMDFNYIQYKCIMSFVVLLLFNSTIRRYAKYPNIVLLLYFICPFALNVAQFRNVLATSIFVYGARYLIDKDESKVLISRITINDIKYIGIIITASMFHSAAFIWLILLLAKKYSVKKNIVIVLIINFMMIGVLTPTNISTIIPEFGAVMRMAAYLLDEYAQSGWHHYSYIVLVIFIGTISILFAWFRSKKALRYSMDYYRMKCLMKSNIIMMAILGIMIMYTQEVYRMQEGLAIINYTLMTNCIYSKKFGLLKMSVRNFKIVLVCIVYALGTMYFEIIRYLVPTIVIPILGNNYIVEYFID